MRARLALAALLAAVAASLSPVPAVAVDPQHARPVADVSDGEWQKNGQSGNVDLYSVVDEATGNDLDYVESQSPPADLQGELSLGAVVDPEVDTGHVLRYAHKTGATGSPVIELDVSVIQGAATVASWTDQSTSGTWAVVSHPLTAPQAAAITDYGNLRVRFDARQLSGTSKRVFISWLDLEVPAADTGVTVISGLLNDHVGNYVVNAGETLRFNPNASTTLTITSGSLYSLGEVEMRPASAGVEHKLVFAGVNEANFVGTAIPASETDPILTSDPGLWCLDGCVLDLQGAAKPGWVSHGEAIPPLSVWPATDEKFVTPSLPGKYSTFDPLVGSIPAGSEAFNITRNVMIEGTVDRRAHVFIQTDGSQTIKHVALRYLGPRVGAPPNDAKVTGRWPMHFHLMDGASSGSVLEGVVVRDAGSHAYVPHRSHGVAVLDSIAFNVLETPYWWDRDDTVTNDSTWDHDLAAGVRGNGRTAGFLVAEGSGNVLTDSVAAGVRKYTNSSQTSGYHWPEIPGALTGQDAPWTFDGNRSHNNQHLGLFAWQNTGSLHSVTNFSSSNSGLHSIHHGAYANAYVYDNGAIDGQLELEAQSAASTPITFSDYSFGGNIRVVRLRQSPTRPTMFVDSTLAGHVELILNGTQGSGHALLDFVRVTQAGQPLSMADFVLTQLKPGTRVRVQEETCGHSWQINDQGQSSSIEDFAPPCAPYTP